MTTLIENPPQRSAGFWTPWWVTDTYSRRITPSGNSLQKMVCVLFMSHPMWVGRNANRWVSWKSARDLRVTISHCSPYAPFHPPSDAQAHSHPPPDLCHSGHSPGMGPPWAGTAMACSAPLISSKYLPPELPWVKAAAAPTSAPHSLSLSW